MGFVGVYENDVILLSCLTLKVSKHFGFTTEYKNLMLFGMSMRGNNSTGLNLEPSHCVGSGTASSSYEPSHGGLLTAF